MSDLNVKIITPKKIKIEDKFEHIIVPGLEGDFGISSDHTPFITTIRPGVMQLFNGNSIIKFAIHDGFVTIDQNEIFIVCDTIERAEDINTERANSARERAEKRLKNKTEKIDFRRAEAALRRALIRISLTS